MARAGLPDPERPRASTSGLDLRSLEMFVRVCETGSMTVAAARLGTSQPAVSKALRQLERTLRSELIDRQARPLRPTAPGEVLLARAMRLLDDADAARHAVRAAAEEALPVLRLGLVDSVAGTAGPALIRALGRDADEVRVWSGLSAQLGAGLRARELDLLVSADPLDGVADLRVERILREPFVLALPRAAALEPRAGLGALAEALPLVRYSLRSVTGTQVERHLERLRVRVPRRMEFDGSESVVAMVQEGLGWAITTPLCLVQGHADLARLRLEPLPGPALRRGLFLIARCGEPEARFHRLRRLCARILRGLRERELARFAPFALAQIELD